MSHSANHKNQKHSKNNLTKDFFDDSIKKASSLKRDLSRKEQLKMNKSKFNNYMIENNYSNSTINTNLSNLNQKDNFSFGNYPIKHINEDNFANNFIPKRKIMYKSSSIINNKVISFQNQSNKNILEFPLFDDQLIFKDINRSYLQDEHSDDGSESSDEKINSGKLFLSDEIKEAAIELEKNLKKNKKQNFLSRPIRFKDNGL